MRIELEFPGGMRADARLRGHLVATDQPVAAGGSDTAPAPFELFLASLATCAGYYALRFCAARGLTTAGLAVALDAEPALGRPGLGRIRIHLRPPTDFPERYREALVRAVDQCAVKRFVAEPAPIEVVLDPVSPRQEAVESQPVGRA